MQESQVETKIAIEQLRQVNMALTLWVLQTMSEQHTIDDDLIKANRQESVTVMVGGVAHDFNNILTTILGNISLAKMLAPEDQNLLKRLSNAEKATLRAQELTQQLLTLTKDGLLTKAVTSIREVIQEAVDFSLRGSSVCYQLSLPDELWPVEIDAGQIIQVIHNLIINAEQAMPDGGVIHIHAANRHIHDRRPAKLQSLVPGPYVTIIIQDNGVGIEAAHLTHIFAPYFTTKAQGSGLGLATAYTIMQKHQGTIYVESIVGMGTAFHLYLPASPDQHVTHQTEIERPAANTTARILIMEDDETLHDVIGTSLDMLGYDVSFTRDGHETLTIYQQAREAGAPFAAVVLDLTIPGGMDGYKTVTELLAIDPQVKALATSGYATDPMLTYFEHYGFCGSIAKPYHIQQLHQVLSQVIDAPAPAVTTGEPSASSHM